MCKWRIMAVAIAGLGLATPARALDWADLTLWDTIFGSVEAETRSAFVATGGKRSFALPLDNTKGFILSASGLSLSDANRFMRGKMQYGEIDRQSRLIFGLERSEGIVFSSVGIGPSMAQVRLRGGARMVMGVALNADIWVRPNDEVYLALSSAADTAAQNWWTRARLGYRPQGLPFSFGPELVASVASTSGKVKLGLHASEIALWKFNIDLSGGVMWHHDMRPDRYITFSTYVRY